MNCAKKLQIKYPIIQAPMAGVTTPTFVAASCNAGALGSIGAGYFTADETRQFIRKVKELTKEPFAINLFVPENIIVANEEIQRAYEALQPIGERLGFTHWETTFSTSEFDAQVNVVIEENVKVCSFTFGLPDTQTIQRLKDNNIYLIGTATTVEEAILAEQAGMDAVVAQGGEAGGHRGSFHGEMKLVPLPVLLEDMIPAVQIPVIAAGGVATKEQALALLNQGAQAVQIGTALLATEESGAHPSYKEAVLQAKEDCTTLTKSFSGKYARGIRNRFIEEMENADIAPYPIQNDLTKTIRSKAAKQGKADYLSLWAGESVHLTTAGSLNDKIQYFASLL